MKNTYKEMAEQVLEMDADTLAKMLDQISSFSCIPVRYEKSGYCSNCVHCWKAYIEHYHRVSMRAKNDDKDINKRKSKNIRL